MAVLLFSSITTLFSLARYFLLLSSLKMAGEGGREGWEDGKRPDRGRRE
jgi:hypothetical protein